MFYFTFPLLTIVIFIGWELMKIIFKDIVFDIYIFFYFIYVNVTVIFRPIKLVKPLHFFTEVLALRHESEWSCICVRRY